MDFARLNYITKKFFINSQVLNIKKINSGLINKTYIVDHLYDGKKSRFILQNLSNSFESQEIVNMNHKLITYHIKHKINQNLLNLDSNKWEVPMLIRCKSNNLFGFSSGSDYWRAMKYIEGVFNYECLEDERMAYQTGLGLAKFHLLCSDFDCSKLRIGINNFHNTSYYINQYLFSIKEYNLIKENEDIKKRTEDIIKSISKHFRFADLLFTSLREKAIDKTVIHGDPKLNNFLFDIKEKYVVSLIDLDTVNSGYFLTDLADCIRSICNLAGEDPENIENVYFDINSFKYFLRGYISLDNEKKCHSFRFLLEYIYLIVFELTIRFLTDFLKSNSYFQINYESHNLFRAEVQYRLLNSFLVQVPNLSNDLNKMGISSSSKFVSDIQKFV